MAGFASASKHSPWTPPQVNPDQLPKRSTRVSPGNTSALFLQRWFCSSCYNNGLIPLPTISYLWAGEPSPLFPFLRYVSPHTVHHQFRMSRARIHCLRHTHCSTQSVPSLIAVTGLPHPPPPQRASQHGALEMSRLRLHIGLCLSSAYLEPTAW